MVKERINGESLESRDIPDYPLHFLPPKRRRSRLAVAGGSAVIVAILLAAGLSSRAPVSSQSAAGTSPTTVSAETLKRANEVLQEQLASGRSPYADPHPFAGDPVVGWVPVAPSNQSMTPEYDVQSSRIPVYSNDDSALLGYDYTYVGFVPLRSLEDGSFDASVASAIRTERFGGCDPLADPTHPDRACIERHFGGSNAG
jgi:hypothetical protein